jgi:response regulator RpfG family c-di-GMP phosphodiesterase
MTTKLKRPILVVDDEPDMLYSLRELLRHEFDVHTAGSGAEGIKVLGQCEIHVVMTDQRMPQMTGVEFLTQIKQAHPEAIRLIFTGYADLQALIDAINQGNVFRYICKPWDPEDLIASLREAGEAYDQIVERNRLLEELRTYEHQCITFDQELRANKYGPIDGAGKALAEKLRQSGQVLLQRIDRVLSEAKGGK